MFDLRRLPFVCAAVEPLVFRNTRLRWADLVPDIAERKPHLAPLNGLDTFPSAGDILGEGPVEADEEGIRFPRAGAYNVACNYGVFKILILPAAKSADDILPIGRFFAGNTIHAGHDVRACTYGDYLSSLLYYPNIFWKLFHSDQPVGLICCSAALGLCALYQSLGFAARRAHVVDPDGKGHYTVEVFDGARWYVVDPDFDFLARSAAGELLDAAETVRRLRDGGADLALESLTRKRRSDRLAGLQEVNDHLRTLGVRVSDPSRVKDWDVEYEFSGSLTWTPVAESGLKVSDTALDYLRTMSVATPLGHAIAHGLIASQDTSLFHIGVDGRPREPGPAAPAFGRDVTPPSLLMTLPPTFEPRGPFGWVARLPAALTPLSDNDAAVAGSPLSLFEDERELGPGHEEHAMICGLGGGAYSFWKDELYFSTPDRSNPNTNGRAYTVRRTE